MPDNTLSSTVQENVLEFYKNSNQMTVTFSQGRFINRTKDLAKRFPDEVKIIAENPDGSIVAHMPVSALHLNIVKHEMTEEQKKEAAKRLEKARKTNKSKKGGQ